MTETLRLTDILDPARANAMQATLGRAQDITAGMPLPPFYHQLYFWSPAGPDELGRDGHPSVGGLIPDTGLPRRMWAGGQLEFHAPLRAGLEAEKATSVENIAHKNGRTGPLAFVTLRHEICQTGALCVTEMQDLVYREDPSTSQPTSEPPIARTDETRADAHQFNSTHLFRYSALTFNGHRIHYDIDYAKQVENYAGLVVHGPLLAQMLMLMAEQELGGLRKFSFRATSPLMHTEAVALCWKEGDAWARGPDGRQCMIASAE